MSAAALTYTATEPSTWGEAPRVSSSLSTARELARSLKQECKLYRKKLRRCQRKPSAKAIHSFRIETRRLQSGLELLSEFLPERQLEKAARLLKRRLDIFDDLRNTQVQLAALCGMELAFPASRRFHAWLCKREERFAKQARKQIRKAKTVRLAKLVAACRLEADQLLTFWPLIGTDVLPATANQALKLKADRL
jgi:CHAD domain-containing protein